MKILTAAFEQADDPGFLVGVDYPIDDPEFFAGVEDRFVVQNEQHVVE